MNTHQNILSRSAQSLDEFYNKVFAAFGAAILISAAGVYTGFHYGLGILAANPALVWGLYIAELALIFTSRMWSQKQPLNYVLFTIFAFISGLTIVPLIAMFALEFGGFEIIYKALFATTTTFVAAALIGKSTKKSLSSWGGFLMVGLIGMIIVGIMNFFIPWGNTGEMIYAGFGVLLFSAFTVYDINQMKRYAATNQYMDAAIALYLDIFNLFISILRLIGAFSRD